MAAKEEKRQQKRYILDKSFTLHHLGEPCRVVDISETGLGISYIGGEDWPERITLEYSLSPESETRKSVTCRTVWESRMDFYKTRREEVVRRRGLEFMEPNTGEVDELHRHLRNLAEGQAY